MDDLRLLETAARLVAWHNRHPLARRITAAHVHAVGYVALPFADGSVAAPMASAGAATAAVNAAPAAPAAPPQAGTLRERALARARQAHNRAHEPPTVMELALDRKTLRPVFSEDFIDPLKPRQVARFALRCGQPLARAPGDGPLRTVRADAASSATLYLLSAVIETGGRKSRVLLGGGAKPAVLGRRLLSVPRLAALAAPVALVLGGWVFSSALPTAGVPAVAQAASASAPGPAPALAPASASTLAEAAVAPRAASAASVAAGEGAASAPLPPTSPSPALVVAPASAASASTAAAVPIPEATLAAASAAGVDLVAASAVQPTLGRIDIPRLRPRLVEPPFARPASGAADGSAATAHVRPPPPPPPPPPAAFALSSRPLRTRAEADQTRVAMKALLATLSAGPVRVDVLPEGDDWRVVGLPFANRAEADQARVLLVSRGMRVEVVGF